MNDNFANKYSTRPNWHLYSVGVVKMNLLVPGGGTVSQAIPDLWTELID